MLLPHRPEYLYRRHVFWSSIVVCAALALVAPGFTWPVRLAIPGFVLFAAAAGYLVGWLPLKLQAVIWSRLFPGFIAFMCLAAFYFFSIASIINLLAYPFLLEYFAEQGISFGQMVAFLPAGIGAAAGAHRVFSDHVVV